VFVLVKRLLAHDDIPSAREGHKHKRRLAEFAQVERDGMGTDDSMPITAEKSGVQGILRGVGRPNDARKNRAHILAVKSASSRSLARFAEGKGIVFAVREDIACISEIGQGSLPLAGITVDEVIITRRGQVLIRAWVTLPHCPSDFALLQRLIDILPESASGGSSRATNGGSNGRAAAYDRSHCGSTRCSDGSAAQSPLLPRRHVGAPSRPKPQEN
jgi:hypothetical protein